MSDVKVILFGGQRPRLAVARLAWAQRRFASRWHQLHRMVRRL